MSKTQYRLTEANVDWLQNFTGEEKPNDAITFLRGRYSKVITISNAEGVTEECVKKTTEETGTDNTQEPTSIESETIETKAEATPEKIAASPEATPEQESDK